VDQNLQPTVTVEAQAALHLKALGGQHLDLGQNFKITGQGIDHTFDELNHAGAIVNLSGINTIYGNVGLSLQPGIGVESVFGPSQLSLLGQQNQSASNALTVPAAATGSSTENDNIIDTGA